MNKKALIFSTAYVPFVSGAEVAVKEIIERIPDIEFDMVTARMDRNLPKFERVGNVNIYRAGIGLAFFDKCLLAFFGYKFANKFGREKKYDAVWAIMASFAGLGALSFKERNKDIPFLLTLQEGDDFSHINKRAFFVRSKFKKIFKRADYVQPISNYLADWAKAKGAVCPIEVVPNGVDLNKFSINNLQFSINDFRKKLGIEKDEKIIITVSRLVKKNGLEDLIKAISRLSISTAEHQGLPVKLLICGPGQEEKKLKKLAKNLKIENKVLFLGNVPHSELPKYLAVSDIFCRPSLSEGLGSSFLEAMAAGVPIIATPVGGIPDFLKDEETGWFCRVKDSDSIAEKIKYILDKKRDSHTYPFLQTVTVNARKLVEEKYNWEKIAFKMRAILHRIINQE